MDFKVLIADSAIDDLKEIVKFVAKDNPEAAIRVGEKLVAHALNLVTMPQRFPFHAPATMRKKPIGVQEFSRNFRGRRPRLQQRIWELSASSP